MKLNAQQKKKQYLAKLKSIVIPVLAYAGVAGMLSGLTVSLFNLGASKIASSGRFLYQWIYEHPVFIPLLFVCLIALALLMALLHRFVPQVRGSGIAQTEGVLRGLVTFKWLRVLLSTVAGTYISLFAGLSLGAEGPSVQIGATSAQGVGELLHSRPAWRRYIVTGGASAGLAVAFNAPLTGIMFALEEGHRRFTPMILLTAASSVITGTITYRLLSSLWGAGDRTVFDFGTITPVPTNYVWLMLIIGAVCGGAAVFFNWALIRSQRVTDRWGKKFPYWARLVTVFVLTGVVGLLFAQANGDGHAVINGIANERKFVLGVLFLLLAVKFLLILFCYNAGATGGLFVPMLTVGAILGGICGEIFMRCGMPPEFYKVVVCVSMTTFFGASVRAPITAIVLIVEIAGYSGSFLSAAVAIFFAYLIAELLGNRPIYDDMLERFCKIENAGRVAKKVQLEVEIELGAFLIGKTVADVLWPANCLVRKIIRQGKELVPDGETLIMVADRLIIDAEATDSEELYNYVKNLVCG